MTKLDETSYQVVLVEFCLSLEKNYIVSENVNGVGAVLIFLFCTYFVFILFSLK